MKPVFSLRADERGAGVIVEIRRGKRNETARIVEVAAELVPTAAARETLVAVIGEVGRALVDAQQRR